jgi:tetratricopeptide (TPR) repeat protein
MDGRTLLDGLADQQPPGKYAGGAAQALAELDDSENKYSEALLYWQEVLTLAKDPTTQALAAARGGWSALQAKQPTVAEKLFQTARQFDPNGDTRKVANTTAPNPRFSTTSVRPTSSSSIGPMLSPVSINI